MRRRRLVALLLLVVFGRAGAAPGEDFRIASKVFFPTREQPSESTTLFRAGFVYDFLSVPQEATVFDRLAGRFVVLDPRRRVQVEITTGQVEAFTAGLRKRADAGDSKFIETVDRATGELSLANKWMAYRLTTLAASSTDSAGEYGEFSDWYVQLNAMLNPNPLPPFGRLAVNDVLRKRGELPVRVQLTLFPQEAKRKPLVLRAEHQIEWRLLEADLRRIDEVGDDLAAFTKVSLDEYQRPAVEEASRYTARGPR